MDVKPLSRHIYRIQESKGRLNQILTEVVQWADNTELEIRGEILLKKQWRRG